MATRTTMFRISGMVLITFALLALAAFFALSGVNPVLAGSGDVTGPGCISYVPVIGETRIKITLRDTESGLASIEAINHKNVNQPFQLPSFPPGYTFGVTGTIDVTNTSLGARVGVRATDMAGNTTVCSGDYVPAP